MTWLLTMTLHLEKNEPILIVGAGVCGLSTAYAFLRRGYRNVHLFDKRDYHAKGYDYFQGCDSPSSDMNKIFRAAYGEQVHYQKMSLESRDVFLKWNARIKDTNFEGGDPIYLNTGNIHLTDLHELPPFEKQTMENMSSSQAICVSDQDAAARAKAAGLNESAVDPFEMKGRGKHHQGVLDTTGGMIIAEKCCRWVLHMCDLDYRSSVTTHFGAYSGEIESLIEKRTASGKKVCLGLKTKDGKSYYSKLVVTACGPWTVEVVPEAAEKLEATGGTVALMKITSAKALEKYDEKKFPTWTYKVRDGAMGGLYGFPVRNGYLKIGYRGLKWTNPQAGINSKVRTAYSENPEKKVPLFGLKLIKQFIREHVPEVSKIDRTRLCWYSDSEDNDFLISYSPYHEQNSLFVVAGDSGHAFMMFGVIGDIVVDIIQKNSKDVMLEQLFSWERERNKLNSINKGQYDPRALQYQQMSTTADLVVRETAKL